MFIRKGMWRYFKLECSLCKAAVFRGGANVVKCKTKNFIDNLSKGHEVFLQSKGEEGGSNTTANSGVCVSEMREIL